MFHVKHVDVPTPPPAAAKLFGDGLGRAVRYAQILAGAGVERGLIGPREAVRLWDRHLLNSVALSELLDPGDQIADIGQWSRPAGDTVGGGPAGLAGDTDRAAVAEKQFPARGHRRPRSRVGITVIRGRAEEQTVRQQVGEMDAVVSRAVASLDKLTKWSMPLLRPGGRMLAMKGERGEDELREHRRGMESAGAVDARVVTCGGDYLNPPAIVVTARRREPQPVHRRTTRAGRRSG